jgi:hypothetical protein
MGHEAEFRYVLWANAISVLSAMGHGAETLTRVYNHTNLTASVIGIRLEKNYTCLTAPHGLCHPYIKSLLAKKKSISALCATA